jgi:hypothetical protein
MARRDRDTGPVRPRAHLGWQSHSGSPPRASRQPATPDDPVPPGTPQQRVRDNGHHANGHASVAEYQPSTPVGETVRGLLIGAVHRRPRLRRHCVSIGIAVAAYLWLIRLLQPAPSGRSDVSEDAWLSPRLVLVRVGRPNPPVRRMGNRRLRDQGMPLKRSRRSWRPKNHGSFRGSSSFTLSDSRGSSWIDADYSGASSFC